MFKATGMNAAEAKGRDEPADPTAQRCGAVRGGQLVWASRLISRSVLFEGLLSLQKVLRPRSSVVHVLGRVLSDFRRQGGRASL